MIILRHYQDKGVNGVRDAFSRGRRKVLLVMPTGAGKTICFSYIARKTAENFKRVMILAHRVELLEQCGEKLHLNEVNFGYLNPKYTPNPHSNVQVGTCQTVVKRIKNPKFKFVPDLIIIDEAHRSKSKTYTEILKAYPNARVLGVTATPVRGDGKPLGDIYEEMIVGPSVKELIAMGALVNPITYAPSAPDLRGVAIYNGDYDKKQLAERVNEPTITGDAIEHYKKYADGLPAVVFCVSVDHAKDVALDFRKAGYNFVHIDGTMNDKERTAISDSIRSGEVHGVTSVDLITEGYDAPILQVAIILRPTPLEGLYIQMVGRVLRAFDGKGFAIILDHANCTARHGLITDEREWVLTNEEKKKKDKGDKEPLIKVKQCPKCYRMHEPAPACPSCGHVYVVEGRHITQKDGTLIPVTESMMKEITKFEKAEMIRDAETFEELKIVAKKLGYNWQWAKRVLEYRNKKLKLV